MPNNKKHWGDVISSLGDTDAVDFDTAAKDSAAPVKQNSEAEAGKPEKKRPARSNAARKRVPAKKERTAETAAFERDLLDSLDSDGPKLDLTVGEAEKKEKRTRRRTKKSSETGLAEKAIAEEEKKERAKRKRLADAIVEKAKEPFRNIASQIEERIQELTQEETDTESEEKPAKKPRKTSSRRKKKSESAAPAAESAAEPETAAADSNAEKAVSGDFWDIEESLEVSWGRSPKRDTAAPAGYSPAEDISDLPAPSAGSSDEDQTAKKLSRRDAEDKFASLFDEKQASEDEVNDFKKRSCRSQNSHQKESEPTSAEEPAISLDDNSFWGIPDEPELGFSSRGKKEPKPERKESRPECSEVKKPEEQIPAVPHAERNERGGRRGREDRRDDREPRRKEHPERREVSRQEQSDRGTKNERSERRSENTALSQPGTEKVFPTWNDAIGDMIRHNIGRHSSGGNKGGDRRKK